MAKTGDVVVKGKLSFRRTDVLASGSDGNVVYKGRYEDAIQVAVKRIHKVNHHIMENEWRVLRDGDLPSNFVRYYVTEEDEDFWYIGMELCHGNLGDIGNKEIGIRVTNPVSLVKQMVFGLKYLHSKGCIHRDIKPSNILLKTKDPVEVKISDFGISRAAKPGTQSFTITNFKGTMGFIAPELCQEQGRYTTAVDVFSLGCVIYYLLSNGKHPFGKNDFDCQENIRQGKYQMDDGLLDPVAADLVRAMICHNPEVRAKVEEILKHPFFWNASQSLQFLNAVNSKINEDTISWTPKIDKDLSVINGNWYRQLSVDVRDMFVTDPGSSRLTDRIKKWKYSSDSVASLIRFIRNKKEHHSETKTIYPKAYSDLGSTDDQFFQYFNTRFPKLILYTWRTIRREPMADWCLSKMETTPEFSGDHPETFTDQLRAMSFSDSVQQTIPPILLDNTIASHRPDNPPPPPRPPPPPPPPQRIMGNGSKNNPSAGHRPDSKPLPPLSISVVQPPAQTVGRLPNDGSLNKNPRSPPPPPFSISVVEPVAQTSSSSLPVNRNSKSNFQLEMGGIFECSWNPRYSDLMATISYGYLSIHRISALSKQKIKNGRKLQTLAWQVGRDNVDEMSE